MKTSISPKLRGTLCVILAGMSWGFSGTCSQFFFASNNASSLWLTCVRVLVSGVILTLMALAKGKPDLREIWSSRGDVALLLCYAIFGLLMSQFAYLTCISYSNAATATVLQTLSIVMTMLVTCLMTRRRPTGVEFLALLLALFGTFMLVTGGSLSQMRFSPAVLFWGVMIAVAGTNYNLLPKALLKRWDQQVVLGYGMLIGGLAINLLARSWTLEVQISPSGWLAVASVIFFGTVIPFPLFMQALVDIGPVKSSMLMCTEPLTATILSAVWLGTTFSGGELVGFASIMAIIFLLARSK